MISYELAKRLKEAGFQWPEQRSFDDTSFEARAEMYPTLSELIEACGEEFGGLVRLSDGTWNAATPLRNSGVDYLNPAIEKEARTPEEAVAMLWLALNSKAV